MYDHGQPPPPLPPAAAARTTPEPWIVAAVVAIILFDLFVAGSIIEGVRQRSLTAAEYADVTGNGVVPGPWLIMPVLTLVAVVPLSAVFGLIDRATGRGRGRRADRFLIAFTVSLAVLSIAALWITWGGSTP